MANKVKQALDRHEQIPYPRVGEIAGISDVDVDLAQEDSYIVGLATYFVKRNTLRVSEIRLDSTIESRIASLDVRTKPQRDAKSVLTSYHKSIEHLAVVLGEAANVPVVMSAPPADDGLDGNHSGSV